MSFAVLGLLLPLGTLTACGSAQGRAQPRRLAGLPIAAAATRPASGAGLPCGAEAAETLASTAGLVARRIYTNELASREVSRDQRQVETYAPLLSALEGGNRAAITRAVTSLVYSHTHIVRLRITSGTRVLADVGGPWILAPVSGTLRRGGRTLGRYVLSVQDDLGYVKLVSRFIGDPVALSIGSQALGIEGAANIAPEAIPAHGDVSYHGARYRSFSFPARAFPSGGLRISLLVPVPSSLAAQSCSAIRMSELGRIAERLARRFTLSPSSAGLYIRATAPLTGGLIFVRAGSHQLAGSGSGPATIPSQGTVRYRGSTYGVFSFGAAGEAGRLRINQLVQP